MCFTLPHVLNSYGELLLDKDIPIMIGLFITIL